MEAELSENPALGKLNADLDLLSKYQSFDWSAMDATDKTYASLMATTFTLKLAAIDTPTSAYEAIKNQAAALSSNIFSTPEFKQEFQLSNPFTDGFGNSVSGGFDGSGNILLNFSKTLSSGTDASSNKTLNATFLGKDVSSMFETDLDFSPKTDFSLTTTDSSGNQATSPVTIYQGDKLSQLANSGVAAPNSGYVDSAGNKVSSSDATLTIEDSDANLFTVIRDDVYIPLKDGTIAAANAVINTISSAKTNLVNFIETQAKGFASDYQDYLIDNKEFILGDLISRMLLGASMEEGMIAVAEVWGVNALLNNDMMTANFNQMFGIDNFAKGNGLESGNFEYVRDPSGNIMEDASGKPLLQLTNQAEGQITNAEIIAGAKTGAVFFLSTVLIAEIRGDSLNGSQYTEAAVKAAAVGALSIYFPGTPTGAVLAIMDGALEGIENRGDLDSQGWQDLGVSTAAAVASAVIGWYVGMQVGAAIGSAVFPGFGTVVGAVVGAIVGAVLYMPLKNLYGDVSDATEELYDAIEDTLIKFDFSSDSIEENSKQAVKAIEDIAKAYLIDFPEDVLIGIYNLFGGNYGQTYKDGEYPTPYSYLQVTPKADGTGNIIQGVQSEGVVAIAREYYHDDLYGNSGSDNLIGKSGTNTIYGYGGNDHLEGRGDIDLLVGGEGDDEAFGGNGDDQIYGGKGKDNLFGGAGNDQILGGEDNDFIQGGTGDDQIMGEAGNDIIQGNAGNDTILGGAGNDTIEGNEGDDSILGEDGDDLILGGAGSDIIDGGAGVDIIQGNEGNDNIRGGDGDDEIYGNEGVDIIYGDEGNDLINAGADNDLVFGGIGNDIIYGGTGDNSLYGEIGNDYVIGGENNDTIDGGADDDVLLGGLGNDTITTGIGNDTIIFRSGDGQDTIDETDTITNYSIDEVGDDTIYLSDLTSKLSDDSTNRVVLTKSGDDLVIQFKDDSGALTTDQITIKNQLSGDGEIVKKIEFSDSYKIDLTALTVAGDGSISYNLETYENIDTTIQSELALGYNDSMQNIEDQANPDSTYLADNYNSSGEQEEIDFEKYNEMQWRSHKEKRSVFGGYYTVWTKYYEQNLSGTNGNDRIVGHWWSENIYGGVGDDQLNGGDGNDNLRGGDGSDILHGGAGDDRAYGEAGEDLIYGGVGNDTLDGGADNDTVYGNAGSDTITGGAGDDNLEGNDGNDSITDNEGNNILIAGSGTDSITAGSGNDKIEGNDDADTIFAGDGNNLVYGNGGNDYLNAGSGNDAIYGQEGFDLINAGAGDDYISGGANDDLINGEAGHDTIYGDTGIDQISGGEGNDYIYGGAGADVIAGDAGNDTIKGGDSDDLIDGGEGDDTIYGESGSDKIFGKAGNDTINGGIGGDVLEGGQGNDTILGAQGNDILVDGAGSDTLDGGLDSDIIILTQEIDENGDTALSTSVDTVKNFNKDEDKIILKVSYKTPISFADVQAAMVQDGADATISLANGQTIIVKNINISDITESNFQIGLSGGANNDILFGTDGEDVVFGDEGDDKVYGGEGNDELWGGAGSDELYGEGGDDILRYEADGKYDPNLTQEIYSDERAFRNFSFLEHDYWYENSYAEYFYDGTPGLNINNDVFGIPIVNQLMTTQAQSYDDVIKYDIFDSGVEVSRENISIYTSKVSSLETVARNWDVRSYEFGSYNSHRYYYPEKHEKQIWFDSSGGVSGSTRHHNVGWKIISISHEIEVTYANYFVDRINYQYLKENQFFIKNFHTSTLTDITGYNRTYDKFLGGSGVNTILMTEGNDVLALDDTTSASGSDAAGASTSARVQDISVIHAGAGDDVINFSTQKYSYADTVVYGGTGNDKIWMSSGDDQIFGGEGNDEIYSGAGNDDLVGGAGDDVIYGGADNDSLEGSAGTNQLYGEAGDDTFIAGSGSDTIVGGDGNDTVSYINSDSAISINLATNVISGGDAANDTIASIENAIGSAYNDSLTGTSTSNQLAGGAGDDAIFGGAGSDIYSYNSTDGVDTITESGSDSDTIQFGAGITSSDLTFTLNGSDLEIQIGATSSNKLILKNQYDGDARIEVLKFDDGSEISASSSSSSSISQIAVSKKFFIASEDVELVFDNPIEDEQKRTAAALYGSVVFDEATNQLTYKSAANFHGIDEVILTDEEGNENKFTVFVNGVNDTPIGDVTNREAKVEEEFSVNLKDYFSDIDGDALSFSVSLSGFSALPDWINFDETTGVLSGKSGRDGKLNFSVTATDLSGASVSDSFRINITRNIADDIRPTTDVVQLLGSDAADLLQATQGFSDIISAGAGDDVIEYGEDEVWQTVDNFTYSAWNVYSGDTIEINGKSRSFDAFDGGDGYDILNLSDQNDVMFLDDAIISNVGEIAKISSIEEINAGAGDDVIDLTSLTFSYEDVVLNGEAGNDVLWSGDGDDTLNGGEGDDNLQSGLGDDIVNGGEGDDTIKAYDGDDSITGGSGADVIIGGDGNDQFIFTNITESNDAATDVILDFIQNEDKIDLSALGFDSITQGQGSNSSALGIEYYFQDGYTIIDDPNSNFAIKLSGEISLGSSDFSF